MGLFGKPSRCEWCDSPLYDGYYCVDLTLGNALTRHFNLKRRYGYFCSPKCRYDATASGFVGSTHTYFLPRFQNALRDLMIYHGKPKELIDAMSDEELMREFRASL